MILNNKIIKNNSQFLKFIEIYKYLYSFPLFKDNKKYYFLNILKINLKKNKKYSFKYIKYLNKHNDYFKKKIIKKYTNIYNFLQTQKSHYLNKFNLFNYYYINLYKKNFFNNLTKFCIYPKYRNLYLTVNSKNFRKFWSTGIFLKNLRFKYKIKSLEVYIKYFFKKFKLNFNKNICLYVYQYTRKFYIFFYQLKRCINILNTYIYKMTYIRFMHFLFHIKFKNYQKKLKVKPRKKKFIRKKYKRYKF